MLLNLHSQGNGEGVPVPESGVGSCISKLLEIIPVATHRARSGLTGSGRQRLVENVRYRGLGSGQWGMGLRGTYLWAAAPGAHTGRVSASAGARAARAAPARDGSAPRQPPTSPRGPSSAMSGWGTWRAMTGSRVPQKSRERSSRIGMRAPNRWMDIWNRRKIIISYS